jgi:hypothetical protein
VWRLRVLERTADRVVLTTENVTPIRVAVVTIFEPGALQVASVLQRNGEGTWDLYEITRASAGSSSLVAGYGSSISIAWKRCAATSPACRPIATHPSHGGETRNFGLDGPLAAGEQAPRTGRQGQA